MLKDANVATDTVRSFCNYTCRAYAYLKHANVLYTDASTCVCVTTHDTHTQTIIFRMYVQ